MKSTLPTLIKLQKSLVDEQRQYLSKLQDIVDAIDKAITELEIEKAREQTAAESSPESGITYGAFLKAAAEKGKQLQKERHAAQHAVDRARAKLSELFEEQKRYEIAEDNRLAAELKEENRRERIDLDEVGGTTHERSRTKK